MIDVSELISDPDFSSMRTFRRDAVSGEFVDGIWEPAPTETFDEMASVQPLTGADYRLLPEGMRNTEAVNIYCSTHLKGTENKRNGDMLVGYKGSDWQVLTSQYFEEYGYNHAIATKKDKV